MTPLTQKHTAEVSGVTALAVSPSLPGVSTPQVQHRPEGGVPSGETALGMGGQVVVPFEVPIPGMTEEEYGHYLSWRIQLQVCALQLRNFQAAQTEEEKTKWHTAIRSQIQTLNSRAEKFPRPAAFEPQATDEEDSAPPAPSAAPARLNVKAMIQELEPLSLAVTLVDISTPIEKVPA